MTGEPGIPVDANGGPTIDPTKNVLDLVEAANNRQDDLRRETDLRVAAELRHLKEMATLRAEHAKEIRALDTDRLEKVRQVDQLNAAQMAQQLGVAVQTLATTAAATNETLRNQVAATASAVAAQNERIVNPIIERLSVLERSSYKGEGRQALADPQMERLAAVVEKLATTQSTGAGKSAGISAAWATGVGIVMVLIAIAGFFATRQATPQPEIRYLPQPAAQSAPAQAPG